MQFSEEEITKILEFFKENNSIYKIEWNELFKKFPDREKEEVIFEFMKIPFKDISPIDFFKGKSKEHQINIEQQNAINSLIAHDPNAIYDFDNPILQHAAVFKIFLDKIYGKNSFVNDKSKFIFERDQKIDNVLDEINKISEEDKDVILTLEEKMKGRSLKLAEKSRGEIEKLMKVLIDFQLFKIDFKMNFIDEYDKYIHHENETLKMYQEHIFAERCMLKDQIDGLVVPEIEEENTMQEE